MESLAVIGLMTNSWPSSRRYNRKWAGGKQGFYKFGRWSDLEDYAESSPTDEGDHSKSPNWKAERIGAPVGME